MTRLSGGQRSGRTQLLVALIMLGLAGVAIVAWRRGSQPPSPEQSPQSVASTFLEQLRSGQIDTAWAGTTAEFKSFLGLERLRGFVRSHAAIRAPLDFSDVEQREINGIPYNVCSFHAPDQPERVRVLLAREAGQLKVERLLVE